ncbi:MAG: hypothetical protein HKN70_06125, partial [Gammaproteobacteria bacterium]|nr:hypothetical protein [Gammaproteobacteria bacterium]
VAATGFRVPITALTEGERGLWNVLLLAPDSSLTSEGSHVVQTRAVELHYQDGTFAYIGGPLQHDDLIVAAGVNRVVPGQHVRVGTVLTRTQRP